MAIGDPYCTRTEFKSYLGLKDSDTSKDVLIDWAINSATAEIDNHCRRQFNKDTTASARTYVPNRGGLSVRTHDFYDLASLEIKTMRPDGSLGNAWATTDYVLEPLNGIGPDARPGWPYRIIRPRRGLGWCEQVQVTAKWGWATVPADVKQAAFILAAANFKLNEAPFGVAGFNQGMGVVKVSSNSLVCAKLKDYSLDQVMVA